MSHTLFIFVINLIKEGHKFVSVYSLLRVTLFKLCLIDLWIDCLVSKSLGSTRLKMSIQH